MTQQGTFELFSENSLLSVCDSLSLCVCQGASVSGWLVYLSILAVGT